MELVNKVDFDFKLDPEIKTLVVFDNDKLPEYPYLHKIKDHDELEKIKILNSITTKFAVDLILADDDFLDNFSLIIINYTKNNYLYTNILLKILDVKYKNSLDLPKIKLFNYTENLENLALEIKEKSSEPNYKKIDVHYLKEENSEKEDYKKIKELIKKDKYLGEIVLIFVDDKKDIYKHFRENKYRIINFSRNEKLDSRSKKINILILEEIIPLNYDNIKLIINTSFRSKENCELLKNYIRKTGDIHHQMTLDFFENLPYFNYPYFDEDSLYKYYLKILNTGLYNPLSILDRYPVEKTFETLRDLSIIDENKVLIDGDLLLSIPLSFKPSLLIYEFFKNYDNIPLFSFILLAILIDRKFDNNLILEYLDIYKNLEDLFLTADEEEIIKAIEKFDIDKEIFMAVLDKFKSVYQILYFVKEIEVSPFDSEEILEKARPVLEKVYKKDIYYLMDKTEYLYTNKEKILKIKGTDYPEVIINLKNDDNYIYNYLSL